MDVKGADGAAGIAHDIISDRDGASLNILATYRFDLSKSTGEGFEELAYGNVGLEFFTVVKDEVGHGDYSGIVRRRYSDGTQTSIDENALDGQWGKWFFGGAGREAISGGRCTGKM